MVRSMHNRTDARRRIARRVDFRRSSRIDAACSLLSPVHFNASKVVYCGTRGDYALPDCVNEMTKAAPTLLELSASRERFLEVVADIRPELHRFCARMTGSVADGEDVLQDALIRAYSSLSELRDTARLRSWLFRMAYNQAIDHLRSYEYRMRASLDDAVTEENARSDGTTPSDEVLAREAAVRAAITRFVELPPLQRSTVILKDVLDHSLQEIAALLEISVPAVQAALHRGRARLRELHELRPDGPRPARSISNGVARYATLFNARNWAALRAMLADDVRLDVVARFQRRGRDATGDYFTNYERLPAWHVAPGWLDGREVLAFFRELGDARPSYFIEVVVVNEQVVSIRDFRHVPYVARDAQIELAHAISA